MKKSKNFKNSSILSTICFGSNFKTVDPSNYNLLYGSRQSLFYLINPSILNYSVKTGFSLLKFFLKSNFRLFFIANAENLVLVNRFQKVCQAKNNIFLEDLEVEVGFLTNHELNRVVIITLFLENEKADLVQKEATRLRVPILCFCDLSFNKKPNVISLTANYTSFLSKNLILSFISLSLLTQC
jgi:hypothetical protein